MSGKGSALIVVDMQRGYTDQRCAESFPSAYSVDSAIFPKIRRLVLAARKRGTVVCFSVISFTEMQAQQNIWARHLPALGMLRRGSPLVEVDSRTGFEPGADCIIAKQWPSVFSHTKLASQLKRRGIKRAYYCGITMSGCVQASVIDSLARGIEPIVVKDAVADRSPLLRDVALEKVRRTYGRMLTTRMAMREISAGVRKG